MDHHQATANTMEKIPILNLVAVVAQAAGGGMGWRVGRVSFGRGEARVSLVVIHK